MIKNTKAVRYFEENTQGRDFVVGDIHGSYDLVIQAMRRVGFKPAWDRIFSVGDLVDRGPDSTRCLAFLAQPYVHAIRGNHESMFLELYEHGDPGEAVLKMVCTKNGMNWWLDLDEAMRQRMLSDWTGLMLERIALIG